MQEGREATIEQERTMKRIFLIINCIILAIGNSGGPLVKRLYFIHGGHRVWLCSFLQSAGFPSPSPTSSAATADTTKPKIVSMKPPLFVASAVIGVLAGLSNYLFAYGMARLPVSTSAFIIATQLAFAAVFAFLLVRHKFIAYSVNAVVLLTLGAGVLGSAWQWRSPCW